MSNADIYLFFAALCLGMVLGAVLCFVGGYMGWRGKR
jgi:hypothetical protein